MRYVIVGSGAVGGTIGGLLGQHGHDVLLVARGPHLDALRTGGLRLVTPTADTRLPLPATDLDGYAARPGDVLVLATKTQDSAPLLDALAGRTLPDGRPAAAALPVICAQNGVENERLALRRFDRVYGMCVWLPAAHLEPGVVVSYGGPLAGILDLGRYPDGIDDLAVAVVADLQASGFGAVPLKEVMRRKYGKLLANLANAFEALLGPDRAAWDDLRRAAVAEGRAALGAAGIDVAGRAEETARRGDQVQHRPVAGAARSGGSTWQSLARGASSTEIDFLNGEIVLLGRLHGVPTPVNAVVQQVARRAVLGHRAPGSVPVEEVRAALDSGQG